MHLDKEAPDGATDLDSDADELLLYGSINPY